MYPYKVLSAPIGRLRSITAAFGTLPKAVIDRVLTAMEIYRQRRALANLDDRLLKDIGISRCDVEREITRSIWR